MCILLLILTSWHVPIISACDVEMRKYELWARVIQYERLLLQFIIITVSVVAVLMGVFELAASCGPPLIARGYIFPYNSTEEGTVVKFSCQDATGSLTTTTTTAVCNHRQYWGSYWSPNPASACESGVPLCQNNIPYCVTCTQDL